MNSIFDEFKVSCGDATNVYKSVVNNLELDLLDGGCQKLVADEVVKDDEDFTGVMNNMKTVCTSLNKFMQGSQVSNVGYNLFCSNAKVRKVIRATVFYLSTLFCIEETMDSVIKCNWQFEMLPYLLGKRNG